MNRLEHESRHEPGRHRTSKTLENFGIGTRLEMESKYKSDPRDFHSRLIYQGFWRVAAQLKTDYEAGRL